MNKIILILKKEIKFNLVYNKYVGMQYVDYYEKCYFFNLVKVL